MTDPVAGQDVEAQARALCEEAVKRIVYATVCRYEGHEPRCNVYGCTRHDHREVVAVRGYVWSALRAAQAEAERGKGAADAIESLEWALGAAERRAQEAEARLRDEQAEVASLEAALKQWDARERAAEQRGRAEGLRESGLWLALQPLLAFIDSWDAKPMRGIDDAFYSIHTGTQWAAELRLSDLRKIREILRAAAHP